MVFVRGVGQAEYVSRMRGVIADRVLLVPVDVGKRSAMAMVANQLGEVVVDPFEFSMDRPGAADLLDRVAAAEELVDAVVVRFGVESAGHYHRTLVETLRVEGVEVVELHPTAVHRARGEMGQLRLKSDLRDLAAMVEVMARGAGRETRWEEISAAIDTMSSRVGNHGSGEDGRRRVGRVALLWKLNELSMRVTTRNLRFDPKNRLSCVNRSDGWGNVRAHCGRRPKRLPATTQASRNSGRSHRAISIRLGRTQL